MATVCVSAGARSEFEGTRRIALMRERCGIDEIAGYAIEDVLPWAGRLRHPQDQTFAPGIAR